MHTWLCFLKNIFIEHTKPTSYGLSYKRKPAVTSIDQGTSLQIFEQKGQLTKLI